MLIVIIKLVIFAIIATIAVFSNNYLSFLKRKQEEEDFVYKRLQRLDINQSMKLDVEKDASIIKEKYYSSDEVEKRLINKNKAGYRFCMKIATVRLFAL